MGRRWVREVKGTGRWAGSRLGCCPGIREEGGLEERLERAGVLRPEVWGDWACTHRGVSALRPGKEIGGVRETGVSDGQDWGPGGVGCVWRGTQVQVEEGRREE